MKWTHYIPFVALTCVSIWKPSPSSKGQDTTHIGLGANKIVNIIVDDSSQKRKQLINTTKVNNRKADSLNRVKIDLFKQLANNQKVIRKKVKEKPVIVPIPVYIPLSKDSENTTHFNISKPGLSATLPHSSRPDRQIQTKKQKKGFFYKLTHIFSKKSK